MPRNMDVARRYAKALFQLTHESEKLGKPQEILDELDVFESVLDGDSDIRKFFECPIVDTAEKLEVLSGIEDKFSKTYKFLKLVIEADRINCFFEIKREFKHLMSEESGELEVDLATANQLPGKTVEGIRRMLEGLWKKQIKLVTRIDERLIGGFIAKAPGKTFDASVRAQLDQLQEKLVS